MGGNIDTDDFIKIFKEITGKSADPLLAGWVYPGKGKFKPEGAVKDDDNDGLNNLEEAVYGTDSQNNDSDNDWFSDFEEMRAGFNPLDPNEPGSQFIITDGIIKDWEKVLFSFSDAKGDTKNVSGTPADFKSIKVYGDKLNNKVHLLVTFHNQITFTKDSPYWLQVQLDLDGDGKLDNRVVFWLPSKKIRIISKYGMTGTRKETGVENRYLSSEGASVYYGNLQNHGFIEATFPLDHFSTKTGDSLTMKVKGGYDKAVDSFDQGPLPIDMQKIYNQAIPSQVFIPEVTL